MFTNMIKWREENDVSNAVWEEEMPDLKKLMDVYPIFVHGVDKCGRPVVI